MRSNSFPDDQEVRDHSVLSVSNSHSLMGGFGIASPQFDIGHARSQLVNSYTRDKLISYDIDKISSNENESY